MSSKPSSKYWIITKKYDQDIDSKIAEDMYDPDKMSYLCLQKERGESTSYDHLQMYVELLSKSRLSAVKKLFNDNTLHGEIRKGTGAEARAYCMKEDTRVAGPWEFGQIKVPAQGKRNDLLAIKEAAKEGKSIMSIIDEVPSAIRYLRNVKETIEIFSSKPRDWVMSVHVYWGATGTGKTRVAHCSSESCYVQDPSSKWWPNYQGEHTVIIDEMDSSSALTWSNLLRLTDRYRYSVEYKGGSTEFRSKRVIFTSNYDPRQWYGGRDWATLDRRITVEAVFTGKGIIVKKDEEGYFPNILANTPYQVYEPPVPRPRPSETRGIDLRLGGRLRKRKRQRSRSRSPSTTRDNLQT